MKKEAERLRIKGKGNVNCAKQTAIQYQRRDILYFQCVCPGGLLVYTHGKHFSIVRNNAISQCIQPAVPPTLQSLRPLSFPLGGEFLEVWIQSSRHQIELDFHALIRAGDQLNGERINWIQARRPSPAVVWHGATAAGKREEEQCVCVCVSGEREPDMLYRGEKESELVRIKVEEEEESEGRGCQM